MADLLIKNTFISKYLMDSIKVKIVACYALVLVIWSTTPLAIKFGVVEFDANWAYALRMFLAAFFAVLLTFALNYKNKRKILSFPNFNSAWLIYLIMGMALFFGMQLVYMASRTLNSGTVSVLHGLGPIITALFSSLMLNQHLSIKKWGALFIAFFGLIIVFYAQLAVSPRFLIPMLMIVAAVTLHMFAAVCVKKMNLDIDALSMTTGGLIMCGLFTLLQILITQPELTSITTHDLSAWISIIYLSSFGSIVAYIAYFYILKRLSAVTVGLVTIITPAFALLLGNLVANEQVSFSFIIGSVIILLSLAWFLNPKLK